MPRLLLLAATTGYQTRIFADAARRLGFDLVLATDRCHVLENPWGDHALPVRFEDLHASVGLIVEAGPFDGIAAVADRPTQLAALAAQALGLPFHPPAAVVACRDKYLARKLYQAAGLRVPAFFRVPLGEDPADAARRAPYPCVLKPLGLSGSRGVIRADDPAEFGAAFRCIEALLRRPEVLILREEQNRYIQVESYIPGREFALEGLVTGGELQVLALFDKPDPLEGPYFEETLYITPSREAPAVQETLIETVRTAVRALGLTHGPLHAELRYNAEGAWMLEAAARPIGGLCAKALRFTGGRPLEELLLRHAVGEDPAPFTLETAASGVMMIPIPKPGVYEGLEGAEEAAGVAEEVVITAKEGQTLTPLPEGASYLGFLFARGDSPAAVERSLREAHGKLRFRISTVLPMHRG